ncbi:3',5'-cyclic-AMP phosphodiesterase [Acinetobacter chinensis]|uniref:3',5'-cyclic-AMP phosphodiesterase n=1 Tax=Acinetobacter chinensis TaxID=2004650 RepID=A0A3B7LS95_9GAMM|nr:3',5'-cyclic-AMP phosphodiesterase [Acinetobacter chinensis]AXY55498.1 3',5'-cyclic-AMP phosphodiesterase [Acinetobacter chinensis]
MTSSALTPRQQSWTIIQITDTHLMDQEDLDFVSINPEQTFKAVIQDIMEKYPEADAIIHTGDLAQVPVVSTYERYINFMETLNVPFYQIPGNHDNSECFPFYDHKDEIHTIQLGQWSICLMNSAVKGKVDGWVEQAQLEQLNQILQDNQDQSIVLACHHHPFEMKSRWIDNHKLKNTEQLTDILGQHNNIKAVLFGHVHQDSLHEWNGIPFLSTPSTCVQFKPLSEKFALDEQAPGYRVMHLHENGRFETQVHRISGLIQKINGEISGY